MKDLNFYVLQNDNEKIVVDVTGKLNFETSSFFNSFLKTVGFEKDIVFNFEHLERIDSSGVGVLMNTARLLNEYKLRIINTNETVMKIFFMLGFDKFIEVS